MKFQQLLTCYYQDRYIFFAQPFPQIFWVCQNLQIIGVIYLFLFAKYRYFTILSTKLHASNLTGNLKVYRTFSPSTSKKKKKDIVKYLYVYIYTHIHTQLYSYIYTYIYIYIYMHIYIYIYVFINAYTQRNIHIHTWYIYIQTSTHLNGFQI